MSENVKRVLKNIKKYINLLRSETIFDVCNRESNN